MINVEDCKEVFEGNDSATSFPFDFKVNAATDLEVGRSIAGATPTVLTLNSHYSVTLNENQNTNPGGTITYPLNGDPLPAGDKLYVLRVVELTQPSTFTAGVAPSTLEARFDVLTMQTQQINEKLNRAVLVGAITEPDIIDPLPADRAGKFLAFDAEGQPTGSSGTGADDGLRTDLADDDGASLVGMKVNLSTAVRRSVQSRFLEYFSALETCTGDGTTDDAEALADLINDSSVHSIYFPHPEGGCYKFDQSVGNPITGKHGLTLFGDNYNTILKGYGGLNPQVMRFEYCSHITVRGLGFDVNGTVRFGAFPGFLGSHHINVSYCRFFDSNFQAPEGHDRFGLIFIGDEFGEVGEYNSIAHCRYEHLQMEFDGSSHSHYIFNTIVNSVTTAAVVCVPVGDNKTSNDVLVGWNKVIDPYGRGFALNIDPTTAVNCKFNNFYWIGNQVYFLTRADRMMLIGTGSTGSVASGNEINNIRILDNEAHYGADLVLDGTTYEPDDLVLSADVDVAMYFSNSVAYGPLLDRIDVQRNRIISRIDSGATYQLLAGIDARRLTNSRINNNEIEGAKDISLSGVALSATEVCGNISRGTPTSDFVISTAGNCRIGDPKNFNPTRATVRSYTDSTINDNDQFFDAPGSVQTITGASDTIYPRGRIVRIAASSGPHTLTSTPSIAAGADGDEISLINTGSGGAVAVQDDGSLSNSGLRLGDTSRSIGQGDVLKLVYNAALASWCETSFANNT